MQDFRSAKEAAQNAQSIRDSSEIRDLQSEIEEMLNLG